jgi:hypothetical protein
VWTIVGVPSDSAAETAKQGDQGPPEPDQRLGNPAPPLPAEFRLLERPAIAEGLGCRGLSVALDLGCLGLRSH